MDSIIRESRETVTDSAFSWREHRGVRILVCGPLEKAGFTNAFSTRGGGVSPFPDNALNLAGFNEDTAENIHENRRRFLDAVGGEYRLATVWQEHGDVIRVIETDEDAAESEFHADAIVSSREHVLAAVKTADCVPVLMADPVTGAYAAVHAGWRGTARSIVKKAISMMTKHYATAAGDLICAIGPAAGRDRYEVGSDVIDAFREAIAGSERFFQTTREGHALVDLHAANRSQLLEVGVADGRIFTAPYCTIERNDLFFSYRLEKKKFGKTGRLLSAIGRGTRS